MSHAYCVHDCYLFVMPVADYEAIVSESKPTLKTHEFTM
jgi:hypothetical protein